uniref:Uncharacterized protein n=1 Tax=Anguilla anguilla TaxID=7936 RepID=A0A0E9T175_ANGAN
MYLCTLHKPEAWVKAPVQVNYTSAKTSLISVCQTFKSIHTTNIRHQVISPHPN